MIKTVIFDIDNTLYDYDKNHITGMAALTDYCKSEFNLNEEEVLACYNQAMAITSRRIGTDTAAIHSRMLRFQCMTELLKQPLFPHVENMYHVYWDTLIDHAEPSPGIRALMEELKNRHIRIGIGTDMTASVQYKKLLKLELTPYIDFIVTSQEAGVEKPHPHFFDICLEKAGCLPEECAFVGDNQKKDVKGALDHGMTGIWYSQEKEPEGTFDFPVIASYTDLEGFLCLLKQAVRR